MGFFSGFRKRDREVDVNTVDDVLLRAILRGEAISRQDALTLPAVSGAVDFISGTIASMPVKLYKYTKGINYFGPTKLKFSLVWILPSKQKKR